MTAKEANTLAIAFTIGFAAIWCIYTSFLIHILFKGQVKKKGVNYLPKVRHATTTAGFNARTFLGMTTA